MFATSLFDRSTAATHTIGTAQLHRFQPETPIKDGTTLTNFISTSNVFVVLVLGTILGFYTSLHFCIFDSYHFRSCNHTLTSRPAWEQKQRHEAGTS